MRITFLSIQYKLIKLSFTLLFIIQYNLLPAQKVVENAALEYQNTTPGSKERFHVASKYIVALFFNQQEEKANQIFTENVKLATLKKDNENAANLYATNAMNNRIAENFKASEASFLKAKHFANLSKNNETKGFVSYTEGWLNARNKKEGEAVRNFLQSINYYDKTTASETINNRKLGSYKELAAIYANWNDYELQKKYSQHVLDLALKTQNPTSIFDANMIMGYMYERHYVANLDNENLRNQAEKYYLKAIDTYNKNKDKILFPSALSFVANNLANLYFSFYPDSYQDKAIYYAELTKKQGIATEHYDHVASAFGIMSEIALKNNNPQLARDYLLSALTEINKSKVPNQNVIVSIYESLSNIAESENNFEEAIKYHKSYMETYKSIHNKGQIELGKRLEAQFEKERKEQQLITMQLEAEKKEQQLSLMQAIGLQQTQEFQNLKLSEENQRKKLELSQLESEKNSQQLKLFRLEKQSRTQEIINYKNEILYKEKINKYYISLILIILLVLILLLYAYKQRSKRLRQNKEIYNINLEKERQNANIATLTAMLDGQEKERGRMARDLHDGLGGLLSSTKISFSQLKDQVAIPYKGEMTKSLEQLDTAVDELRRVAHNLMPDLLNRYGLKEALKDYVIRMSNDRLDIDVQFLHYETELNKDKQLLVYRIIQELVNNAIKHASPNQILIQIVEEQDNYNITVEDDGVGFDVDKVKGNNSAGLYNIQSRIDFLNGKLNINSEKQIGTSVEIIFPKK